MIALATKSSKDIFDKYNTYVAHQNQMKGANEATIPKSLLSSKRNHGLKRAVSTK